MTLFLPSAHLKNTKWKAWYSRCSSVDLFEVSAFSMQDISHLLISPWPHLNHEVWLRIQKSQEWSWLALIRIIYKFCLFFFLSSSLILPRDQLWFVIWSTTTSPLWTLKQETHTVKKAISRFTYYTTFRVINSSWKDHPMEPKLSSFP